MVWKEVVSEALGTFPEVVAQEVRNWYAHAGVWWGAGRRTTSQYVALASWIWRASTVMAASVGGAIMLSRTGDGIAGQRPWLGSHLDRTSVEQLRIDQCAARRKRDAERATKYRTLCAEDPVQADRYLLGF